MNEKIESYINEKRSKECKIKNDTLINLGLYEKEYNPEGSGTNYSEAYPEFDYKINKYYKKVAVECTDEEYNEILKCSDTSDGGFDTIAAIFKAIAIIIYVVGFFIGLALNDEHSPILMIVAWIATFIVGISYHGFGQIITLLYKIYKK